ncbi:MAG: nucleoside triphosphate pyrophosphohydrolase [Deltaproteobacteria bacterium]|nr:nucleoside triphosphate pyrophosphohydrolase [Deltaproteobacteria bacterium]
MKKKNNLNKLTKIMERLRSKDGCPWDREQTIQSIVPFIIEEAYEVIEAIDLSQQATSRDEKSYALLKEELGDLLHQIIFICQLAKEKGKFDIGDVINSSIEKMIRRHPHVFGKEKAMTPKEALKKWEGMKKQEGKAKKGFLSDVPHLPALLRAHKVSEKAARIGFDWQDIGQVFKKVEEEILEFKSALKKGSVKEMEEELGDILFTIVNVARFIEINPEDALRKTVGKFITRIHFIEKNLLKQGKDIGSSSLDEMEKLWQASKGIK